MPDRSSPFSDRAVLWDMDGTLADSGEPHWLAWQAAMAAIDRTLTRAQFDAAFGQRNDRFLRAWLGDDVSDAQIAQFADDKEAAYRRQVEAGGLAPLPGAVTWVRRLARQGWRQAVASSAPRANVAVMMRAIGLDALFETYVGGEDVTIGKPDPQVFLAAAAALGVAPGRCVVVEDAAVGVEAARRAGMRSVGVSRDVRLDADLSVNSLEELADDAFERLLVRQAETSPGR